MSAGPALCPLYLSDGNEGQSQPFFTIAIPHYNRRRYLEVNIASVVSQAFADFEILISDDHSSDDSGETIPALLRASGRVSRYFLQPRNLGYDGNVRFCLREARGRYVLMLGNDDALASPDVLGTLYAQLTKLDFPEVCVTNFKDWQSAAVTRRIYGTSVLGSGPSTAVHYFRLLSFTSGLIFDRSAAARHDTDRWDRSIYYQMFLGCRILAAGGRLAGLDTVTVLDHIRLNGDLVPETYRVKYRGAPLSFKAKHTGLDSVARVTIDAIKPYLPQGEQSRLVRRIYVQLLAITYPYWLFEYRQLANWGMGFGVARDLWPRKRMREYSLRPVDRLFIWATYLSVTVVGLMFPASLFNGMRHRIAAFVRRKRQRVIP